MSGSRGTENTTLTRFEQEDSLALPNVPLKLRAAIKNETGIAIHGVQATLDIDGQSRPLILPDLPSGQTTELPLTVTLPKPGQHVLHLSLPNDLLPADNSRWLSITARSDVKIAMIDGMLTNRPFESSTDFLQVAFTAGIDPWQSAVAAATPNGSARPRSADTQLNVARM